MTTVVQATTKTGSKGELKVAVIFTDTGWATPVKFSQDIGTDFVDAYDLNVIGELEKDAVVDRLNGMSGVRCRPSQGHPPPVDHLRGW